MESASALVNGARQRDRFTANGMITNSTSLNNCVDLFFVAGATRTMSAPEIHKMLTRSWTEDKELTLRLIFWAGNIRGGAGERRFFEEALKFLYEKDETAFFKIIEFVPEFNRWTSLFLFPYTPVFEYMKANIDNGLLCKWMPRKNQYDGFGKKFRKFLKMNAEDFRKMIVKNSKTVEQLMCQKEFGAINYSQVPSVAMNKYRTAFYRNDESRFKMFIEEAIKKVETTGEKIIKAEAIFPYDIYKKFRTEGASRAIDAQWMSLPNYMEGTNEKILPMCDLSGSMTGLPMDISISLGVYLSERNTGLFKDAWVSFSGSPVMNYLQGSACDRFKAMERGHVGYNTDLDKAFDLILNTAVRSNVPAEDMPSMLLIISDMEFDNSCISFNYTAFDMIQHKYRTAGYEMPKIVFWNVNGRAGNVPVNAKTKNVALVSGASPAIMKSILSGRDFTPRGIMLNTIMTEVYDKVVEKYNA